MPIADYRDTVTGEVTEVYFKTRELPDTVISEKTGNICEKVISSPGGFKFKGPGFYATEYPKNR